MKRGKTKRVLSKQESSFPGKKCPKDDSPGVQGGTVMAFCNPVSTFSLGTTKMPSCSAAGVWENGLTKHPEVVGAILVFGEGCSWIRRVTIRQQYQAR